MPDEKEQTALFKIKAYLDAGHSLDAVRQAGWASWIDHLEAKGYDLRTGQLALRPPEETPAPEPMPASGQATAEADEDAPAAEPPGRAETVRVPEPQKASLEEAQGGSLLVRVATMIVALAVGLSVAASLASAWPLATAASLIGSGAFVVLLVKGFDGIMRFITRRG